MNSNSRVEEQKTRNAEPPEQSDATGGQKPIGLVKIEVNGDELPIFGKLSVESINAHSSGGGRFLQINKEAVRDKPRKTARNRGDFA